MAIRPLNILGLCAGIGGLERGIAIATGGRARTVCYVEGEAFAAACLATRMQSKSLDSAPIWADVKTFDANPWRGVVDCIAAGYPCQPFSAAGRRRGDEDPRHLWPYIAKIIAAIKPRFVFCENVPGHLTLGFEQVCHDLQSLGYAIEAGIFSAAEVGAPHLRKRLYFLAHPGSMSVRQQQHRSGEIGRPKTNEPARHGEQRDVANPTDDIRRQQCAGRQPMGRADNSLHAEGHQGECGPAFSCEAVADADVLRCEQGCAESAIQQRGQRSYWCGDRTDDDNARQTQPRLGEPTARLPNMVDPPAGYWGPGWEDNVPRVTTDSTHRTERLRALGNAVVPQTAALAWRTLMAQAGLDPLCGAPR